MKRRTLFGAAALGLAGAVGALSLSGIRFWDPKTYDVIVVGAGAAGLSAAVEAAGAGASVLVLEKQKKIGGNTLISGGFYTAVDPERQKPQGVKDSEAFFFEQTYDYGGRLARPELVRHLVTQAGPGLRWLESLGMKFEPQVFELYGAHWPRAHTPVLPLGVGYIRTLSAAALARGAKIETGVQVTDLVEEKGRIAGVVALVDGRREVFRARKGVVVASGSFAANPDLIAHYAPALTGLTTNNTAASTGEVMLAAHRHGATLIDMEQIQCLPGCPPGKRFRVRFHNNVSRFIFVNQEGRRFIREDGPRDALRDAVLALPGKFAYTIVDADGFAEAGILTQKEAVLAMEAGEAWKGATLGDLARKLGIPAGALKDTVAQYNRAVSTKSDSLGKAGRELRHPIAKPPFYASYAGMTIHYTEGGLAINVHGECLREDGSVIPGLFAAGTVTGGVHGKNRLGGNGLADAVVFGRTAGCYAATGKDLPEG